MRTWKRQGRILPSVIQRAYKPADNLDFRLVVLEIVRLYLWWFKLSVHDCYSSTAQLLFWSVLWMAFEGTFIAIVMLFFAFLFTWIFGLNFYSRAFIFVVPIFIHFGFHSLQFLLSFSLVWALTYS